MKEIANKGSLRTPLIVQSEREMVVRQPFSNRNKDVLGGALFIVGGSLLAVIIAAQSVNQFALVLALTTMLTMVSNYL
jgi:hypothetical protein